MRPREDAVNKGKKEMPARKGDRKGPRKWQLERKKRDKDRNKPIKQDAEDIVRSQKGLLE